MCIMYYVEKLNFVVYYLLLIVTSIKDKCCYNHSLLNQSYLEKVNITFRRLTSHLLIE